MFNACLANHFFTIENHYSYVASLFEGYKSDEPGLVIAVSDKEIEFEAHGENGWESAYLESLAIYRKICE